MDKILSYISIAAKAGKVVSGEFAVEKAIKSYKASIVIISEDASENTKKHFTDICNYRSIRVVFYGTKETLGNACGKEFRSSVAICEKGLSDSLYKLLAEV